MRYDVNVDLAEYSIEHKPQERLDGVDYARELYSDDGMSFYAASSTSMEDSESSCLKLIEQHIRDCQYLAELLRQSPSFKTEREVLK